MLATIGVAAMSGGLASPDHAAAAFAPDGIGFQPRAVVVVDDLHFFTFDETDRIYQAGYKGSHSRHWQTAIWKPVWTCA